MDIIGFEYNIYVIMVVGPFKGVPGKVSQGWGRSGNGVLGDN